MILIKNFKSKLIFFVNVQIFIFIFCEAFVLIIYVHIFVYVVTNNPFYTLLYNILYIYLLFIYVVLDILNT